MDGNEKKKLDTQNSIEDKLRELTGDTQIPPSLEPEAVEKMLLKKKKEKAKQYFRRYAGVAAAACLCLAVGVTASLVQR